MEKKRCVVICSSARRSSLPAFTRRTLPGGAQWLKRLLLPLAVLFVAGGAFAQGQTDRILLPGSIVALPAQIQATILPLAPQQLAEPMQLEVTLRVRNPAKLMDKIGRGEIVPAADLDRDYLPLPAQYEAVRQWLATQGLQIAGTPADRLSIYVCGTLQQIKQTFQTEIVQMTVDGQQYNAASTAPSIPVAIATSVLGINGLQPYIKPRRFLMKSLTANRPPYLVSEIRKAYAADTLSVTGSGQTIAILIDAVPRDSDLTAFWAANGIPQSLSRIQKVLVTGTEVIDTEIEATLDVEWSSSIAPQANVRIYAMQFLDWTHFSQGLDMILADLPTHPDIGQLSISLGLGETDLGSGIPDSLSQKFALIAASGVGVFVASGDQGSNPNGELQVFYPASDPSVSGVGGTTLSLDAITGQVTSETTWAGSGGGLSQYFDRPAWQSGPGLTMTRRRQVPDISLVADPYTSAYIFFSGSADTVGGTSWSAPTWAGFSALINEARARASQQPLGPLCPQVYPLLGTSSFSDITSGANGAYQAGPGYDMTTGVGVPRVATLLQTLTGTTTGAAFVSGFTPSAGAVGTPITVYGQNLSGATAVVFDRTAASFSVITPIQLSATVPAGATDGPITVITSSGSATSASVFTVMPAATNDSFANAADLTGPSGSIQGTNVGATKETGEPYHAGNSGGASVWYRWTAPNSGQCTFDTRGSSFDTLLAVYTGNAVGSLTLVGADDDANSDVVTSSVSFMAAANTVYYIAVDGYAFAGGTPAQGTIELNWAYGTDAWPDLTPFAFRGWSAPIVVSNQAKTTLDSPALTRWDSLFIDFAVANIGTAATAEPFDVTLSLDGSCLGTWTCDDLLQPLDGVALTDLGIGSLPVGMHSLVLDVDPTDAVTESDKSNNSYTKSFRVMSRRLRHDFNGDGHDDILLQNATSSALRSWLLDGQGHVATVLPIGGTAGQWKAVASADLNSDNSPDIILQNAATASVRAWLMDGHGHVKGVVALSGPLGSWRIAGTADLNGDGVDDLLLQNTATGAVRGWIMDGHCHIRRVVALHAGGAPVWRVAATADLDGDGNDDLVLQNSSTGAVRAWLMDGNSHIRRTITLCAGGNGGWKVVGAADIDRNGIDEIVLQNASSTAIRAWRMDGHCHVSGTCPIGSTHNGTWHVIER